MRPINRGDAPRDSEGVLITFSEYQEARGYLIRNIGEYCSYCEMRLDSSLAVEHIEPKHRRPDLELEWTNFLLACVNCNSTKNKKDIVISEYFWPDRDNTFQVLKYSEGGIVSVADQLSPEDRERASRLIELVGLDKTPADDIAINSKQSDRRWNKRRQAWDKAVLARKRLETNNSEEFKDTIADLAVETGYWSVWFTVFQNNPDILSRLIKKFPGTSSECFDQDFLPIRRIAIS
jgi:uncharacterized protein (TIGR02646 family)